MTRAAEYIFCFHEMKTYDIFPDIGLPLNPRMAFTCSKITMKHQNNVGSLFKINNKNTATTSMKFSENFRNAECNKNQNMYKT